jgi:hypothetical protein
MSGCASGGRRARRVAWIAWAAWGTKARDGGDVAGAQLDAAVGVVAGAVSDPDLPPRQPDELGVQAGLVGLDDQQVVGAAIDNEAGLGALGVPARRR